MGKKSSPKAPTPPDPTALINAQTAANNSTATTQRDINLINTSGPSGSVNYSHDPNSVSGITQTTTLSPQQQTAYDLTGQVNNRTLGVANDQIGRVGDALSKPLDLSGLPALSQGVNSGHAQTSFDQGPALQYDFAGGGPIQKQVGPTDFTKDRRDVTDAVYGQYASRLDPQWQQREGQLQQKLANQGLSQNSAAYANANDQFNRGRNDDYNQARYTAVQAGANEQNTLFGQSLAQGQFANSAQQQQFGQNEAQAAFHNNAAGQQYGQNLGAAQFANSGTAQQFNQDIAAAQFGNQSRNQGVQEQAYVQNQPINQLNSLMSGTQVQTPQGVQYTPSSVAPTDVLGSYALNSQAANANYQAQVAQQQGALGGLFSLGSAALGAAGQAGSFAALSDERLKYDIEPAGKFGDHNLYRYRYLFDDHDGEPRVGVMAQEVMETRPDAVRVHPSGFLMVDYGAL